ncbi:tyrosine-type recombinase/integrase family protein [Nocardia puris]|uniref:tyrosine-type recombinase/integrase n=1 Tax=Nocardia puris TaxID=208602 RepID=UPI0018954CF7|nr:tyrosine-type recombinase/integrase [Nocardia puris]MBF6460208.1 tyrosine-type recombinase/integrase family protein [Nocardia puris]
MTTDVGSDSHPYRETRKKTVTNKRTGEKRQVEYTMWAVAIELPPKPNGERDRKVIRRKNRNAVIAAKNAFIADLIEGRPIRQSAMTLAQWLEYWLIEIAKPRLRPRVYRSYVSMVRRNIIPHIGTHRLVKVEPKHVRYMLSQITKAGLSARTAEVAYNVLHVALRDGLREPGLGLRQNVVDLVDKPRTRAASQDRHAPKAIATGRGRTQRTRAALTSAEARAVIRAALDTGDPLAVRWAFALLTGARQGECLGLETDRVDLDAGTVDLSWAIQRLPLKRKVGDPLPLSDVYPLEMFDAPPGYEVRPLYRGLALVRPKTDDSVRALPLPAPLLILLRAHIETMRPNRFGLVWVKENGLPYDGDDDRAAWAAALRMAGAPDVVLHAARHTTATLLLEANVPEEVRMAIMGQSSAAAQRAYAHTDLALKRAALSELNSVIVDDDEREFDESA